MRYPFIDRLRFIAIVLMVFYHFSFDLNFFHLVNIPIYTHWFWYYLPRLIVFLFLICVGFSLRLQHEKGIRWDKFIKWEMKLIPFAALISLVTYFAFPKNWIYFGTLHCIATTGFMALPFRRWPRSMAIIGTLQLLLFFIWHKNIGWFHLGGNSFDYIPALPWVGAVFIGFWLHEIRSKLPTWPVGKLTMFSSRHSLKIYLLHQVIMFPIIYVVAMVLQS